MVFVAGMTLAFYLMQQFGMMLGFGAEMVLLFTYLVGRRAGVINDTEDGIAHGIYHILVFSLFFVIISGVGIVGIHAASGQADILLAPSFVMKWIFIIIAAVLAFLLRGFHIWNSFLEGLSGANWGALFLLHIFAPITTFFVLIKLYVEFIAIFLGFWYLLMLVLHLKPLVLKQVIPQKATATQKILEEKKSSPLMVWLEPLLALNIPFFTKHFPLPTTEFSEEEAPLSHTPQPPPQPEPIIFSPERTSQLSPIRVMPQSEEELRKRQQEGGITEV